MPTACLKQSSPVRPGFFPYRLSVTLHDGRTYVTEDPYRFPPVLTDYDLHLFSEGNHFRLYDKLGAHIIEHCGVPGVSILVCGRLAPSG